jgi:N-acetyl-anhydromuramyl-L-alanine amidase AmpD
MKNILLLFLGIGSLGGQNSAPFLDLLQSIAPSYASVPSALAAAVAYHQSRWEWIDYVETENSHMKTKPIAGGYMGFIAEETIAMHPNGITVSELSGISVNAIRQEPLESIRAWFIAMSKLNEEYHAENPEDWLWMALMISEIPMQDEQTYIPQTLWLEETAKWWELLDGTTCDLSLLMPLDILESVQNNEFSFGRIDHPGVSVVHAPACNTGNRPTNSPINSITIHTAEATYAGILAWYMNCSSQVSSHYLVRSSDGAITQMVAEASMAFHNSGNNEYTIGIVHEGFMNNPAWFSPSLYSASGALASGICNRQNINSYQTGWWPDLSSMLFSQGNLNSSCFRIRGHQHYPGPQALDPGPYWNWPLYYHKVQGGAGITSLAQTSGHIIWPQNNGYYPENQRFLWTVGNGTRSILGWFPHFHMNFAKEYVFVYDGNSPDAPLLGVFGKNALPPVTLQGTSGFLCIEFRSECNNYGNSFEFMWAEAPPLITDSLPPVTQIVLPNHTWITQSFQAHFNDLDAQMALPRKCFIHTKEHDGQDWRSNSRIGFFYDSFTYSSSVPHPDWTVFSGNWQVNNGKLTQNQTNLSNSNISVRMHSASNLEQMLDLSIRANGNQLSSGIGVYLFADSALLPDRGNSILVWLGFGEHCIRLYRCDLSGRTLLGTIPVSLLYQTDYQIRLVTEPAAGRLSMWLNHQPLFSIPNVPYPTQGRWLSFSTQYAELAIDSVWNWISRPCGENQLIPTGSDVHYWLRNPNPNPVQPGGAIASLSLANNGIFSAIDHHWLNIDFTPPSQVQSVSDGNSIDLDTISGLSWSVFFQHADDQHSGISMYWIGLGSQPCLDDIMPYDSFPALASQYTLILNPQVLQTGERYYSTIRAVNQAGLVGQSRCSNGAIWEQSLGVESFSETNPMLIIPNPSTGSFRLNYPYSEHSNTMYIRDYLGRDIRFGMEYDDKGLRIVLPPETSSGTYMLYDGNGQALPFVIYDR